MFPKNISLPSVSVLLTLYTKYKVSLVIVENIDLCASTHTRAHVPKEGIQCTFEKGGLQCTYIEIQTNRIRNDKMYSILNWFMTCLLLSS